MNGSRGAKGSVKDRLISTLYRTNYKKEIKKEDFTISNKEKQKDYLKTLDNFRVKGNVDTLDKKDQKKISNIKTTKIETKTEIKKSYNDSSIKKDISKKTYANIKPFENNQEVIDIKKEIKKVDDEITILKEVDTFINESLKIVEDIKTNISTLKEEVTNKNQDFAKIEDKQKKIKEKKEKLKLQYEKMQDKYDLSALKVIDKIRLIDAIDEYKDIAKLDEMEMIVSVCKEEIKKIKDIKITKKEEDEIDLKILKTKQEQNDVLKHFTSHKTDLTLLTDLKKSISYETEKQKKIVDEMYDKASNISEKIEKKLEFAGNINLLSSVLKIAGGLLTIPFTRKTIFGHALGATLINDELKDMSEALKTKEKVIIKYNFEDISSNLRSISDIISYTSFKVDDSLEKIKHIKEKFTNEYSKFDKILPNYKETLDNLNNLETKLINEQKLIKKINEKVNIEQELNKQKMQKIKTLKNNSY